MLDVCSVVNRITGSSEFIYPNSNAHVQQQSPHTYITNAHLQESIQNLTSTDLQENTSQFRFTRSSNQVFRYDFKVGNYLPDDLKRLNPQLFTTIKDVTMGIRKSSWFTSPDYNKLLRGNVASHLFHFTDSPLTGEQAASLSKKVSDLDSNHTTNATYYTNVTFSGSFYNFFYVLGSSNTLYNTR